MIDWTARRAAARAYLAHDLKRGRVWSSLKYDYDKEQDDATNDTRPSDNPDRELQTGAGTEPPRDADHIA